MASGKTSRELDSIKADNQALVHDFLVLKGKIENLKKNNKRGSEAVTEKNPHVEPAKGKSRQAVCAQTPVEWAKLTEVYRKIRDEKDTVEREVSAIKDKIKRIKIATPSSLKQKTSLRRKSGKMGISTPPQNDDVLKITSVRKVGEERDGFHKRVCNNLGKLLKVQLEILCAEEEIDYTGVKKTASQLADIYTARAFDRPTNRRLVSDDEHDGHAEDEPDDEASTDVAGTSMDTPANSETS
ncbi:hypothetical protein CBR_g12075 [Chara braunii]|uniref:Uncharacterized protein n=1 Tax=Chara braunii TaxID=69332 RepID=A0A388KR18_CHABU|nr:hypothetical protein CBR_g12075 [Chara braunii]|eukprot:GBG72504.1 hypothetical protein CBR_g12075 [Chara braunii]